MSSLTLRDIFQSKREGSGKKDGEQSENVRIPEGKSVDEITQEVLSQKKPEGKPKEIRSKEEFFRYYEPLDKKHMDPVEKEIFDAHRFYPIKSKDDGKIYVLTIEKNIFVTLSTLEDKKPLSVLTRYAKTRKNIVVTSSTIYFDIIDQTSVIDKDYTDEEARTFFEDLLVDASRKGASDIHITWRADDIEIKYRIDGKIVRYGKRIQKSLGNALRTILVAEAGESEYTQTEVSGQISKIVDGAKKEYRISIGPTVHGYNIVIRMESSINMSTTLESKGYTPRAAKLIRKLFKRQYGIILVTGPTGSGKSTLLATCIIEKLNEDPKYVPEILTVEDPVEIVIDGINQVQVNTKGDKSTWITFKSAIKMFLRQDPDMIVVGEIRDGEVAMEAITAAKTGHLAASTLHTNDVASTFTRLNELGVDNANIEDGIIGVISQRLINKLCKCKIPVKKAGQTFYKRNPVGCPDCMHLPVIGCNGLVPICEIAVMKTGRENYKPENFEEYHSMEENVIYLLEQGIIDEEEASRYIDFDTSENLSKRREILEIWTRTISSKKKKGDDSFVYASYQPIVDATDYVVGYEALMRLKSVEDGHIMRPAEFMERLKKMKMYQNFSSFMLDLILDKAKKEDRLFFWNIEIDDILDKRSISANIEKIAQSHVNDRIVIEFPFDSEHSKEIVEFVRNCRENGIRLCINSFEGNVSDLVFFDRYGIQVDFAKTSEAFILGMQKKEPWIDKYIDLISYLGGGTRVIATRIETPSLLKRLRERYDEKIFGYQGFGVRSTIGDPDTTICDREKGEENE